MHTTTGTCRKRKISSLPVRDVGLIVPVLPALQRVDVCVHTGLATGHRTRHGESRGSGSAGRVSRGSVGVGTRDQTRLDVDVVDWMYCLCRCETERASQLSPLCCHTERRGERKEEEERQERLRRSYAVDDPRSVILSRTI